MAKYQASGIPIPQKLKIDNDSDMETNWKRFKRAWDNYEIATGLKTESNEYRCAVLLTCIGDAAVEILEGFKFEDEESDRDIEIVLTKFEEYCVGTTHEAFESFKFNSRIQEQAESIDTFVSELRRLAKGCKYGDQEDRMIRDRILVGCKSDQVREKLLEDSELTLKKAVETCRAHEASQNKLLAMSKEVAIDIDRLSQGQGQSRSSYSYRPNPNSFAKDKYRNKSEKWSKKSNRCPRCGYDEHKNMDYCPAKRAECRKCKKIGHFAIMCRTSNEEIRHVDEESSEMPILGSIEGIHSVDEWHTELLVENTKMKFRIDTGADVTVVPDTCFRSYDKLQKTSKQLFGPGGSRLDVVGVFVATLETENKKKSIQDLYVVKGLKKPLLGKPAIEALNILQRVNNVESNAVNPKIEFPELFQSLGRLDNTYEIRLKENAKPFSIATPRRLPLPLKDKVEEELKCLQKQNIIRPVTNPTEWCAPIVVVPKSADKIRLCVDFTKLNESVKRENFPLPTTDQLLAQLDGATVFTKLDCNKGFHQIPLAKISQELTTFITPFGRFCYERLPFGINSGPEIFHREMTKILSGIPGVICDIDDVLIVGKDTKSHDERLRLVLQRMSNAGMTLNDKCVFSTNKVKFLGHIISEQGIGIDPDKTEAISNFPAPKGITELRRFLGMVNHVAKFIQNLAEVTKPLRDLLKKESDWIWGQVQEEAFDQIKKLLSSTPVLQHYNPNMPTKVSADASSYGIGGVLMQKEEKGNWKPVFYVSRSLTSTEQRYAQIEKEALAMTWVCERFSDFLVGMSEFIVETDHKPLLALMKSKNLDQLTPRIQRFRMRMMIFSYRIIHTAGKNLTTADTLSRAPSRGPKKVDEIKEKDVQHYIHSIAESFPASDMKIKEIRKQQCQDYECSKIMEFCLKDHWPDQEKKEFNQYFIEKYSFSVVDNLLLYGSRLVIPKVMRSEMLERIHQGHQGIVKTRALARTCIWWPGMSKDIANIIESCPICEKYRREHPQPLSPTPTPDFPWQRVASDLFEWQGENYLLIVDYFSRWIEISHLNKLTSQCVINSCKAIFARLGIPEVLHTDNGTQYSSREFARFAEYYGFTHLTSSPLHPSGNGEAERAVQTIKNLLRKEEDPFTALLNYRATPLLQGWSPAELLMGRQLRTRIPIFRTLRNTQKETSFRDRDIVIKQRQKRDFDLRHRVKELPPLRGGQEVWIKTPTGLKEAVVTKEAEGSLRSVPVTIYPTGYQTRRNRTDVRMRSRLSIVPPPSVPKESDKLLGDREPMSVAHPVTEPDGVHSPIQDNESSVVITRSGRTVKPRRVMDL